MGAVPDGEEEHDGRDSDNDTEDDADFEPSIGRAGDGCYGDERKADSSENEYAYGWQNEGSQVHLTTSDEKEPALGSPEQVIDQTKSYQSTLRPNAWIVEDGEVEGDRTNDIAKRQRAREKAGIGLSRSDGPLSNIKLEHPVVGRPRVSRRRPVAGAVR